MARNIADYTPTVRQDQVISRKENEVLFSGGICSGLTESGLMWLAENNRYRHPECQILVLSTDTLSLYYLTERILNFLNIDTKVSEKGNVINLPAGGKIRIGHSADEKIFTR